MTLDGILGTVTDIASSLDSAARTQWYVFGSALTNVETAADIDVLVVYEEPSDPEDIRDAFRQRCIAFPVHFLFITEQEDRELNFILLQGCRKFYPHSAPSCV